MTEKVGVYVCHCGSNIAGKIDVVDVAKWAGENLPGCTIARDYKFMCSSLGQDLIKKDIAEQGLTRVVVAACSPHLHEKTFRTCCAAAGLNAYLMQMTNLREHVSWVSEDKAAATEKAKALVSGAVARVQKQVPLEPTPVPVTPHTLIIGGGIAGIQAALELADAGSKVTMVEREPSIGGHMAQFDKTFPTLDCSACILTPKMSECEQHKNITLMTWSELEELTGYVGNFRRSARRRSWTRSSRPGWATARPSTAPSRRPCRRSP
jgi:heterodisulfide reductase subunit A